MSDWHDRTSSLSARLTTYFVNRLLFNILHHPASSQSPLADDLFRSSLARFRRDLFIVDPVRPIKDEVYCDVFAAEAQRYGLEVNLSAWRQGASAVAERFVMPLAKLSGEFDGDEDSANEAYGEHLLRQMGHSAATANAHYAGGEQQLDSITRTTVLATSHLTCGEWHVLLDPTLRDDPVWKSRWGRISATEGLWVSTLVGSGTWYTQLTIQENAPCRANSRKCSPPSLSLCVYSLTRRVSRFLRARRPPYSVQ